MAAQRPRKTKLGVRHALALRISPKQTNDARPLSKRQEEALTKLAKKAKQLLRTRALFSGPSGTGKTLAVEFLARELEVTSPPAATPFRAPGEPAAEGEEKDPG